MTLRIATLLLAVTSLFTLGCGGDGKHLITGTVTYDGQLVEKGQISFLPVAGDGAPEGSPIVDGKFEFRATPGQKRVEIRGSRAVPPERQTNPEMGLMYEDFIPAQFNRESTLTTEVGGNSDGDFDFALTSTAAEN